jgi:hypothetical protein
VPFLLSLEMLGVHRKCGSGNAWMPCCTCCIRDKLFWRHFMGQQYGSCLDPTIASAVTCLPGLTDHVVLSISSIRSNLDYGWPMVQDLELKALLQQSIKAKKKSSQKKKKEAGGGVAPLCEADELP